MARPYALVDHDSWRPFLVLVVASGLALLFSIPSARVVVELDAASQASRPLAFFYIYVLAMGILGLGLGATSADRNEVGLRMLSCLTARTGLAQLLCLPYLIFASSLLSERAPAVVPVAVLATFVALASALLGRLVERPASERPAAGFLVKYGLFLTYNALPFGFLPAASPLGAVHLLLGGAPLARSLVGFAVPVLSLAVLCPLVLRRREGAHV